MATMSSATGYLGLGRKSADSFISGVNLVTVLYYGINVVFLEDFLNTVFINIDSYCSFKKFLNLKFIFFLFSCGI